MGRKGLARLAAVLLGGVLSVGSMPGLSAAAPAQSVGPVKIPGVVVPFEAVPGIGPVRVGVSAPVVGERPDAPSLVTPPFHVTYGVGFTPAAQAAFQAAVDIWSGLLTTPVTIEIKATWESSANPNNLGSAGAQFVFRDFAGARPATYYPVALANAIVGSDLSTEATDPGMSQDINANFNSTRSDWYFGTDGNPGPTQYDLTSVVLHEIGHGLGFAKGFTYSAGTGDWFNGGPYPFIYDVATGDAASAPLLGYAHPSTALGSAMTTGQAFLDGVRTFRGARNLVRPELYTPDTWAGGSSMSHLDEIVFPAGNPNSLMTPFLGANEAIHTPGPVVLGQMADSGWASSQVPDLPPTVTAAPGNGQATVNWIAPADTGGKPITGYTVTALQAGTPVGSPTAAAGSATSTVVPGLTNGTAYTFKVSATNAIGRGPDSVASAVVVPTLRRAIADFNGDGRADKSIYRPSTGEWWVLGGSPATTTFGVASDVVVPGDYDGSGTADKAVFRPSTGQWFILGQATVTFGDPTDIPVPGDYDGNGTTDKAVYRPGTGQWFILGQPTVTFGISTDIPVPGDFDGNGTTDKAVFRPSTGTWYVLGQGSFVFGVNGDIPVPADYDGDGRADVAVFRPSTGTWYVLGQGSTVYGANGDVPVPADYDGNGTAERAIYRPSTGAWWVLGGSPPTTTYGTSSDIPLELPNAIRRFFP